jgi:hypothetical protein
MADCTVKQAAKLKGSSGWRPDVLQGSERAQNVWQGLVTYLKQAVTSARCLHHSSAVCASFARL